MSQLNQMYVLGNLTRDPEIKFTNEGAAICEMGLAVNKRWVDRDRKGNVHVLHHCYLRPFFYLRPDCIRNTENAGCISDRFEHAPAGYCSTDTGSVYSVGHVFGYGFSTVSNTAHYLPSR